MKVVLLAGGFGTRLSEETSLRPKPMIEIGEMPLIMHIMHNFAAQGFNDFIICLGYKGFVIKEYFANLHLHLSDLKFASVSAPPIITRNKVLDWKVELVDTGLHTMTGGRIKRIQELTHKQPFLLTYGDGLADINLSELIEFHKRSGGWATVTAVNPPARFGALEFDSDGRVSSFNEKIENNLTWINGGFFVLEQQVFDYIEDDFTVWEKDPLADLARAGKLNAYKHRGFWKPCDTLREKRELEELWNIGAPWKNW